MKWRRAPLEEKKLAYHTRIQRWHRRFAWLPLHDEQSCIVYWLRFVWCRGTGSLYYNAGRFVPAHKKYTCPHWEYRGGKHAPDVKTCPVRLNPVDGGPA